MGKYNVDSAATSELEQEIEVQTTTSEDVDKAGTGGTTKWTNTNWTTYNSYYKNHVAIKSVINKLGMWAVGKGFKANKKTKKILDRIRGWGKDTFNGVTNNQIRIEHINGDSYAEIICKDNEEIKEDGSNLINLKPLNPLNIGHKVNDQGILEGYTQKRSNGKEYPLRLNQVFHLCLNRTADEIHGTGDIQALTNFLDKIKQLDEDMATMFHRFVVPMIIWSLNTDDETAVADFQLKQETALNKSHNLVIPDKAVEWSLLEAGKNGVDPMNWRNKWTEEVIKGGGVPALIMAIEAGTTEASSKMVYLAWQQVIEDAQRTLEDQIKAQLGLTVEFEFPARIEENLSDDENKDGDVNGKEKGETEITNKAIKKTPGSKV